MKIRPFFFLFAALLAAGCAGITITATPATKVPPASSISLPINSGMPQIKAPRVQEARLSNGLRVLVVGGQEVPTFTAQLVFPGGGGLYEPVERRGVAGFTAQMLREGSTRRSAKQIAQQLEQLGVTLDAAAPLDSAVAMVTVSGLANRFDAALALTADVVRNPAFRQAELARYASRSVAELALTRARPEFLAQEQLARALYGVHPAGLAAPPASAIAATTQADLARFHQTYYRPDDALLVVVGAVTLEQILPSVRRAFANWKAPSVTKSWLRPVPPPGPRAVHLVDRPGSVQTVIQLGVPGVERTDADYFALVVANEILGGQSSSRLHQNLREKNGYTYGAYSGLTANQIPGYWQIQTPVRTEVTRGALTEIFKELTRMRDERVSVQELAAAQRALIGRFIFSLERPDQVLHYSTTQALYKLPPDYWSRYASSLIAISAEDVQRVARRYFAPERVQLSAVGDGAKIRDVLGEFGPMVAVDAPARSDAWFSAEETQRLGETLARIAGTVIAGGERKPEGLAWVRQTADGKPEEGQSIYNDSPGQIYFLLKTYAALGKPEYLRAAERGLDYLLSQAKSSSDGLYFDAKSNGVFEGNAGPGYVFLYAYHVTGEKRWLDIARKIATRIYAAPDVAQTSSPDIISGAAGTGLFLLEMHAATGERLPLEAARGLGDFLLAQAEPRGNGVTWKLTASPTAKQPHYYFVGFSHGPAGIAYYLDKLYRATGDERYRKSSEAAMLHIESIAIKEKNHVKWYHEELKRATRYSSQWCHGAPGMSPYFLTRYDNSAEPRYLNWAENSTRYLLDQGVNIRHNASVCHGVTGNTAALVQHYRATGNAEYLSATREAVELLYSTMKTDGKRVWWDEDDAKQIDYTYMSGLAGVGDFFALLYTQGELSMFGPLGYGDDMK